MFLHQTYAKFKRKYALEERRQRETERKNTILNSDVLVHTGLPVKLPTMQTGYYSCVHTSGEPGAQCIAGPSLASNLLNANFTKTADTEAEAHLVK